MMRSQMEMVELLIDKLERQEIIDVSDAQLRTFIGIIITDTLNRLKEEEPQDLEKIAAAHRVIEKLREAERAAGYERPRSSGGIE